MIWETRAVRYGASRGPSHSALNRIASLQWSGDRKPLREASIDCKDCDEVTIHLFFEADTFRHVLTTYSLVTPSPPTEGRSLRTPMKDPPYVRDPDRFTRLTAKARGRKPETLPNVYAEKRPFPQGW
jgi:hypothetical protein